MTDTPRLGRNPYRPGVGIRPPVLAGREQELQRFAAVLRAAPEIPANVRLTGLRGVGKTVLLAEFEATAQDNGWAAIQLELEPRHNTEDALAEALSAQIARARNQLSAAANVRAKLGAAASVVVSRVRLSYEDVALSFGPPTERKQIDLSRVLFDAADSATAAWRLGFAILLDESQVLRDEKSRDGEHPLSVLLAAITSLQRAAVPISLVLCGLPTLTTNLLRARTYTERMFRGMEIGPLYPEAAQEAFAKPLEGEAVSVESGLVDRVLQTVEGYPYFIQLWGAELWDAALNAGIDQFTHALLDEVEPQIYERLDIDFYEPRVQTLTPAEQDLLFVAARCQYPPLRVADIQQFTNKRPGNVNVLLGRLVEAGVLFRIRKGEYAYTAPKFADYLARRVDRPVYQESHAQLSWTEGGLTSMFAHDGAHATDEAVVERTDDDGPP